MLLHSEYFQRIRPYNLPLFLILMINHPASFRGCKTVMALHCYCSYGNRTYTHWLPWRETPAQIWMFSGFYSLPYSTHEKQTVPHLILFAFNASTKFIATLPTLERWQLQKLVFIYPSEVATSSSSSSSSSCNSIIM